MATNGEKRLLVIGMPAAGKTTFLAALWHVVESQEIPGSLKLTKLEGNREYIGKLRDKWLACDTLGRTTGSQVSMIHMKLRDDASNLEASLTLPDISGETFRAQLAERAWTPEYDTLAAEATGAMLFIHPNGVIEPVRIDEAAPLVEALGGTAGGDGAGKPWSVDAVPSQVHLIELLQFHQSKGPKPFHVCIVISAWDLVSARGQNPSHWLDATMPLLAQFLRSNAEALPANIYGISAQGGELAAADDLLAKAHASLRIKVVDGIRESHDITKPIAWLLKA